MARRRLTIVSSVARISDSAALDTIGRCGRCGATSDDVIDNDDGDGGGGGMFTATDAYDGGCCGGGVGDSDLIDDRDDVCGGDEYWSS